MPHPVARASVLIRRPPAEVFDAFVDPARITGFWLAATSGPLADGARVRWQFMVPGAAETVSVTAFEPSARIGFDWSDGVRVDMRFVSHENGQATRLTVEAQGFDEADAVAQAVDATEGFSIVLCDLKTLLESGQSANLVRDKAALIAMG